MRKVLPHSAFFVGVALSGLLASIGLLGGLFIQLVKQDIIQFLPLLIALPALNAIAGDYAAITAAHLGDPENYNRRTKKLAISLLASLPISSLFLVAMSLGVAYSQGFGVDRELVVSYATAFTAMLIVVAAAIFTSVYVIGQLLKKYSINTDDTLIPIANTLASIFMLIGFAVVARHLDSLF